MLESYMGGTGQFAWRFSVKTQTLALTIASWVKVWSLWPILVLDNDINHVSSSDKNIERNTAHTIVLWPKPKQWVIIYTSDFMMIIK